MMSSPSELSLDCKPHSYSLLLKSITGDQQQHQQQQHQHFSTDQPQKLEEFLSRLEEERLKIDAFKRELPLCMQLLTNAMEDSRQQLQTYRANQVPRPVLEEFIPLKTSNSESSEKVSNVSDKATWMTTAQLWSQSSDGLTKNQHTQSTKEGDINFVAISPKLGFDTKQRNSGAFLPFSKERNNTCPNGTPLRALPELALAPNDKEVEDKICVNESTNNCSGGGGGGGVVIEHGKSGCGGGMMDSQITAASGGGGGSTNTTSNSQTHRKARRCWSPDLHRRFVNALNMLGGSQVATPKQIRELMKVDGLTNDEVKSHLQKYRLHTRRPSPSPQATGAPGPQLVVLGGIWVQPEYATAHHHGGPPTALYGTGHPTPHYCPQPVPQEFYHTPSSQPPPHHQLHHHTLHHQLHMYNNNHSSRSHGSPESDIRGGTGDRSESIEDGKSEGSSWKADSGAENGGERKVLVLREDGEESNGSDITLKF